MTAEIASKGRTIGNVFVLDIRNATEESLTSIDSIGNVVTLICSAETKSLVPRLSIGDIAHIVEAEPDAKVITGSVEFTQEFLNSVPAPLNLIVVGKLLIHPDVSAELLDGKLAALCIVGKALCPEHLMGIIESKSGQIVGKIATYIRCNRLVAGALTLDEHALHALEDDSVLVVQRDLELPKVLPQELLDRKTQKLQVLGRILCHEENVAFLQSHLHQPGTAEIKSIPAGFELVEKPLVLDAALLEVLPSRKIMCIQGIQIENDISPEKLDQGLDALVVEGELICPAALRGVVARKCNLLQTETLFYEGELWLADGEETLSQLRLQYLESPVTLVVTGELTVDADVPPEELVERIVKVHNHGEIRCNPAQMAALQSRLGTSDGEFVDSSVVAEEEEHEAGEPKQKDQGIGNVVHLIL